MPKRAVNPNQLALFRRPDSIDDAVSDAGQKQEEQTPATQFNLNRKNQRDPYGVKTAYFNGLSRGQCRRVHHGMYNCKTSDTMLSAMNADEIIALFYGVQKFKENVSDPAEKIPENAKFETVVSRLVSYALEDKRLLDLHNDKNTEKAYTDNAYDLIKRMKGVDRTAQETFIKSLKTDERDIRTDGYDKNKYIVEIRKYLKIKG